MPSCLIRPSTADDLPAIIAIDTDAVLTGTGTGSFETEPPTQTEVARRRDEVLARGLPWLVAETPGGVPGFADATPFTPRRAYRFSVEDSVYPHSDARGQGLGRLLLAELIGRCADCGARQMLAVIGDSANSGSFALQRSLGFEPAGRLSGGGLEFDRWLNVVLTQRALGAGATAAHDA